MSLQKATATTSNPEALSVDDKDAIRAELELIKSDDSRLTNERVPTDDSVTNAKVAANAAIEPTKIVGTAVVNNDARLTDERTPIDGSVTNAKVAANAEIDPTKIAGTAVVNNDARLTDERTPIDGSVTNTKLSNVATSTIKGRVTAGTGIVEDLTQNQVKTLLSLPNDTEADLTAVETTANGALQRSGGEMTGAITGDQSARLFRPQGTTISASVSISALDKNSFFEINATSALTITLADTSEPNVVREFMITNGGSEDRLTILNSTGSGMVVSGLGLLANGESFTVKSVGDAFTIRSRSNSRYVIVGGEFTLVESLCLDSDLEMYGGVG